MQKITACALTLAFALATLPFTASAAVPKAHPEAAAGKSVPGWFVEQKMEYQGNVKIYAGPSVSKVVTRAMTIYLNQKDDQAILVNEAAKTKTVLDRRSWTDANMVNSKLVKDVPDNILKEYKITKAPPKIIAGHKCIQHWAAAFKSDKRFWFWWEYWTPVDMKLPTEIANQWRSIMHLPAGESIPFVAIRHFRTPNQKGHQSFEFLKTIEAKQKLIPIAELTVPSGLKKVGDELDSVFDAGKDDELDKLFATTGSGKRKP